MPEILKHGKLIHECLDCGCQWRYKHNEGEVTPTTRPKCPECQSDNTALVCRPKTFEEWYRDSPWRSVPAIPLPYIQGPGRRSPFWYNRNEVTCE